MLFLTILEKKIKEIRLMKDGKSSKNFQDKKLPHELFLTTRQATKKWISIVRNGLADVKLSKA